MTDETALRRVALYTDGACSGNPGPGGWAYVLRDKLSRVEREDSGGQAETTNNQMEMMAVIQGLRALKRACEVELYSDSAYVLNGLKSWMAGWKRNGWKRVEGGRRVPVKNAELWMELDDLVRKHRISYHHIKGHSGHPENERCDELAVAASMQYRR